jgi:hypothetical protein
VFISSAFAQTAPAAAGGDMQSSLDEHVATGVDVCGALFCHDPSPDEKAEGARP